MRTRLLGPLVALVGVGAWTAGCSTTAPTASSASRQIPDTPAPALSPSVRCGAAPDSRPRRTVTSGSLALPGAPDGIATTPDGRTSFVAIQSGAPRIAVIANGAGGPRLLRTLALPAPPSGMRVTPDGREVLAAAGRGAVILNVAAARAGAGAALVGVLSVPRAVAGNGPGAAEIAVSADSRHAFVTLEGAGRVAVFDLRAAFARRAAYLGAVRVGAGALGIVASPDGRRLYEVSESARLAGHGPGVLNVIDLARAVSDPGRALLSTTAAPCAPVRVGVSPQGDVVWVTARDANALLGYSARALSADPARALRSVTRVGGRPLGLAVVSEGTRVLVAALGGGGGYAGISVVAAGAVPRQVAFDPSGQGDDAIAPAARGHALVTQTGSATVAAVSLARLPGS